MEHSSRQSRGYLTGLIRVVNILLWSNTVFIVTQHGLHGKPASYIYTGAVISSNSVGLQKSASRLAKPTSHSTVAGIMYLKIFDHILKILFWMFWLYIYKHHIPPDGTTAVALDEFFISESVLESSLPQEEQIMHEGISTSKVSASLLQGNMVPIII